MARNKTLEEGLRDAIKKDAKRYKEMGARPTHCLMHPDTWIAVIRDSTLPKKEKEKAERGEAYKLNYTYSRIPTQAYDGGYSSLLCYPAEGIERDAALICDKATASLHIDDLLSTEDG